MKTSIFIKLIKFLETNTISYSILGNVNSYPDSIGSDVDIVIDSVKFNEIISLTNQFSKENGLSICNLLQHEIEGKYFVISSIHEEKQQFDMLALDFCNNYMRQGRVILTEKELLSSCQKVNQNGVEFSVCNNEIAFLYYLIKKIEKKNINDSQFIYLSQLWDINRESIIHLLCGRFNKNSVQLLIKIFDSKNKEGFTKALINELNKETEKKYRRSIKNQILEFKRKITRFVHPTGVIISIFGCDGAGKSTVINHITKHSPEFEPFRGYEYHHLFATTNKTTNGYQVTNPHEQVVRSKFLSNLKLLFFLYKYVIGYFFIAYPQKVRSKLVIFDRYYYDILVDPIRYRHNGNKWLTNFIGKIIPKPDLFFTIDASVEVIQERKKEVSFEETIRQREEYISLKENLSNLYIINNSHNVESASYGIKKIINDYLVQRYKMRYKK